MCYTYLQDVLQCFKLSLPHFAKMLWVCVGKTSVLWKFPSLIPSISAYTEPHSLSK